MVYDVAVIVSCMAQYTQCGAVMTSLFSSKSSQKTPHSSPFGMSFGVSKSGLCFAPVIALLGIIMPYCTALKWHLAHDCTWNRGPCFINTLRPRQNGRRFPDYIFKCIFLNENVWIEIKISLKFVPKVRINDIPALVQIMAWHQPGDKPLSEPMMVSLLMHLYVTWPQWFKKIFFPCVGIPMINMTIIRLSCPNFMNSYACKTSICLVKYTPDYMKRIVGNRTGIICVCSQPMKNDVTMYRRFPLVGHIHKMIPVETPLVLSKMLLSGLWQISVESHQQFLLLSWKLWMFDSFIGWLPQSGYKLVVIPVYGIWVLCWLFLLD